MTCLHLRSCDNNGRERAMTHPTNELLHEEADRLLRSGLWDALSCYGDVCPVGSYALGLRRDERAGAWKIDVGRRPRRLCFVA